MCECQKNNVCKHPEKLQGQPGSCSPQQIEECHGQEKEVKCACIKDEE